MVTLMISSLLVIAAFATANNGIPLARADQNTKQAFAAAEAGVAFYAYHLAQDPNYWTYCTDVPNPASPNPLWDGSIGQARLWRSIPAPIGSPDPGPLPQYSIRLMTPQGSTKCVDGLASTTFLNNQTKTLTIQSTGRYRGKIRTIQATFGHDGFVKFLWFTNYETPDPLAYAASLQAAANRNCAGKYSRPPDNRSTSSCDDQQFITLDSMLGPMHTNDRYYICGSPQFGGSALDTIEAVDTTPVDQGCSGGVRGNQPIGGANTAQFPPTNQDLASDTLPGWTFTGKTVLHFQSNGTVRVTNNGVTQQLGLPANNVLYVKSSTCGTPYQEAQQYVYNAANIGCGDVWVDGTYPTSFTIGADNDIIVAGNLLRGNANAEMGLIANGFVRVYHPIVWQNGQSECNSNNASASDAPHDIEIDAAILSLQHSFLVDNAKCGDPEGTLTVDGAIAQNYRGTVGTHSSGNTISTGFAKNYIYDQQLRYQAPPYFLDPVKAAWDVQQQAEVAPADCWQQPGCPKTAP
jgi:hypothetical protein